MRIGIRTFSETVTEPEDPEIRIGVTRFIVYLMNVPICWRFKVHRDVTLSISEAGYVSISEAVIKMKFMYFSSVTLELMWRSQLC
jgi:hypothetical protein